MSSLKGKLVLPIGVLLPVKHVLMGIYGPDIEELGDDGERGGESRVGCSKGRLWIGAGGVDARWSGCIVGYSSSWEYILRPHT